MKTLTLKREALAELSDAELSGIGAGAYEMTPSCPLTLKISELICTGPA